MKKTIKLMTAVIALIIVACLFCVSCVNTEDNSTPGGNNGGGNETPQKKETTVGTIQGIEGTYYPSENYTNLCGDKLNIITITMKKAYVGKVMHSTGKSI